MKTDRAATRAPLLGATGAILAALAIGLSAYAAHGLSDGRAQHNLQMAALYTFGHGAVLVVMGRQPLGRLARCALMLLLLGTLLFAGSLAGNALGSWPTALAPAGGMTLMGGWLLLAVAALRD